MRPKRDVMAVLLLASFATVGCSKDGEMLQAKAGSAEPAAKSVATPLASPERASEGKPAAKVIPKITAPVSFSEGEAAYRARNYRDAAVIFEHYIEQRPSNAWGHYMLGLSAWKIGDLAKSEQAF